MKQTARQLHDHINDLVDGVRSSLRDSNRTLPKRTERAVLEVTEAVADAEEQLRKATLKGARKEDLVPAAKELMESTARAIQVINRAAEESTSREQKQALKASATAIQSTAQASILAAKPAVANPDDAAAASGMAQAEEAVMSALQSARKAVTHKQGWTLDPATEEAVATAIERDALAGKAILDVGNKKGASANDRVAAARDYAVATQAVVASLRAAKEESKDSAQKQRLQHDIDQLSKQAPAIIEASKSANPDDDAARAKLAVLYDENLSTLRDAHETALGGIDGLSRDVQQSLLADLDRMQGSADSITSKARSGATVAEIKQEAASTQLVASTTATAIETAAASSGDPAQKARLLRAAERLRAQTEILAAASSNAAAAPQDKNARIALDSAHQDVTNTLLHVRDVATGTMHPQALLARNEESILRTANAAAVAVQKVQASKTDPTAGIAAMNDATLKAARALYVAANDVNTPDQRADIVHQAEKLQADEALYAQMARELAANPKDSAKQAAMARQADLIMEDLKQARRIAHGQENDGFSEKTQKKMLDTSASTKRAALALRDATVQSAPSTATIDSTLISLDDSAASMGAALDAAIAESKDEDQKAKLLEARQMLDSDLLRAKKAAKLVAANPGDADQKAQVAMAVEGLVLTANSVRAFATGKEEGRSVSKQTEETTVASLKALDQAAVRATRSAEKSVSGAEKKSAIAGLDSNAESAVSDLLGAAAESSDPVQRAMLMDFSEELRDHVATLRELTLQAQAKPEDATVRTKMIAAQEKVSATVKKAIDVVSARTMSEQAELGILEATDAAAAATVRAQKADAAATPEALAALQRAVAQTDTAVKSAVASSTSDKQKAALTASAAKLSGQQEKYAAAVKAAAANPSNATLRANVDQEAASLLAVLREIRGATTGVEDGVSDLAEMRLLDATDKDAMAVGKLGSAKTLSAAELATTVADIGAAREQAYLAAAGAAAEAPVFQRARIIAAAEEMNAKLINLTENAKKANQVPNDVAAQAALAKAHEDSIAALRVLRNATTGNVHDHLSAVTERRVHQHCDETRAFAVALAQAAGPNGSVEATQAAIDSLNKSALLTISVITGAAAETNNPIQRAKLLAHAEKLRVDTAAMCATAKQAAAKPTDSAIQRQLQDTNARLIQNLDECKLTASGKGMEKDQLAGLGLEEAAQFTDDYIKAARRGQLMGSNDLVVAAAEAARQAMRLAEMAEAVALDTDDLPKRAKILASKDRVTAAARELMEAQRISAANPEDAAAQARVDQAYKTLNSGIQEMVGLCMGEAEFEDEDMKAAMHAMMVATETEDPIAKGKSGVVKGGKGLDAFGAELLEAISGQFLKPGKRTGVDYMNAAKDIAKKAEEFLKQLQEFIDRCEDPIYKERLKKLARLIKDKSVQVKIISAVKSSSSDSADAEGAIQAAAKGLQDAIAEAMREQAAAQLRKRFTKAVDTVVAMRKVVSAFKKPLKKKV
eukprot:TRINITY_DN5626_c0_g1_i2.p1 TRINITY_DN5626_c0_g1~~TRINITY_DN5626_c0_g1_i2.p1  ORF type:complete len:1701 (-),score=493.11 TRINITY_DN5626_c0_g1_i2:103-4545(-)